MTACQISTVRDLVSKFGGTGKFAEFLSVVPSAVSNMLSQGRIPPGYHLEIYLECERRGWPVNRPSLFGVDEQVAATRRKKRRHAEARVG